MYNRTVIIGRTSGGMGVLYKKKKGKKNIPRINFFGENVPNSNSIIIFLNNFVNRG
jgi:hypothetical protein